MAGDRDGAGRGYSGASHKLFLLACTLKQKCDFLNFPDSDKIS